jgi:hypothetical protein
MNFSLTLEDCECQCCLLPSLLGLARTVDNYDVKRRATKQISFDFLASSKCSIAVLRNQNTQAQLWTRPSNKDFLKCSSRIGPNG